MKRVITVVLFVSIFSILSACNKQVENSQNTPSVASNPAPSVVPAVISVGDVKSFEDFSKIKSQAWDKYSSDKSQAWDKYSKIKSEAFSVYWEIDKAELQKFRGVDKETYMMWLDAEKMGDYTKKINIEKSCPAASAYVLKTGHEYDKYKKIAENAYEEYKLVDDGGYKKFKQIEDEAYKKYKEAEKKK